MVVKNIDEIADDSYEPTGTGLPHQESKGGFALI